MQLFRESKFHNFQKTHSHFPSVYIFIISIYYHVSLINYNILTNLGYKDNEIGDIIKNIEKEILLGNLRNNKRDIIYYLCKRK